MSRLVPGLRARFCPLTVHIADNGKLAGRGMGNETRDSDSASIAVCMSLSQYGMVIG